MRVMASSTRVIIFAITGYVFFICCSFLNNICSILILQGDVPPTWIQQVRYAKHIILFERLLKTPVLRLCILEPYVPLRLKQSESVPKILFYAVAGTVLWNLPAIS